MRVLSVSVVLVGSVAWAQRGPVAPAPSGTGYSTVSSAARPAAQPVGVAQPAGAAQPVGVAQSVPAGTSTVSVVGARPTLTASAPSGVVVAPSSGPRGPSAETNAARGRAAPVARVSTAGTTYAVGSNGVITTAPAPSGAPDPDAGVDDPSVPTSGALFGGPVPGPSIAYMGQPVNTRRAAVAPPLAPGAVAPGHTLPGSVAAPPTGSAPWIPHSTSGFQLGPRGTSTEHSGYGFQLPAGQRSNPGTIRNTP